MKTTVNGLLIMSLFFFLSCKEKKTYKQQFEEKLETNIEHCMKPFLQKGADSLAARNACHCIMNTLFEIDSTFFLKSTIDLDKLINSNESEFQECRRWVEEYLQE